MAKRLAQYPWRVGLICLVVVLGGCASPAAGPASGEVSATRAASGATFAGLVDIGGGRRLYLTCRGSGSPTVVLISGTGGGADEWTSVADSADPAAPATASPLSVFDTVARTTRVCAYDRPGTTLFSGAMTPSTLVAQPTTARQGVNDLEALLTAGDEPGPFVLVGASWGGMIAQLFARTHPKQASGIVLVDSASAFLKSTFTSAQWAAWMASIASAPTAPGAEVPVYEPSLTELQSAGGMPHIPAVVLSSDQPWDLRVTPGESTWPAWLAAQDALARSLHATHVSKTDSGHGIAVEQPTLVADAIRNIVERVR